MNKIIATAALALALGVVAPASASPGHGTKSFTFGEPGDPAAVDRTVEVSATDDGGMAFGMNLDTIEQGETIRFVVTNEGALEHEFSIGDTGSQRAHAAMMAKMPGMDHGEDPSAVTLQPGETKEIVWTFSKPIQGEVVFACQIPGHYEAGMVHKASLKRG